MAKLRAGGSENLDAVVLAVHVALFPRTLAGMARHTGRALQQRLSAGRALVAER